MKEFNIQRNTIHKIMDFESFYRTQNTIFELLNDRHYIVDDKKKISIDEFDNLCDEDIQLTFEKKNGIKILVSWRMIRDVGINPIKEYYAKMQDNGIQNAIIIKMGKLTPNARTTIAELSSSCTIQVFDIEDLKINKTKHVRVPKHELLSRADANKVLDAYKVKKIQIPRIFVIGPIIQYYGWKRGNIVKITRKDGDITYRCIV